MSENNNEKSNIEIIMHDEVASIDISGYFYEKLRNVASFLTSSKTNEEMTKALTQIKEQNITESWVSHLETMLILCSEYEKRAREKGIIKIASEEDLAKLEKGLED